MTGWFDILVISYITPFHAALSGLPIDHIGNLGERFDYCLYHFQI